MLTFEVYERQESTLKSHGSVKEIVGADGFLELIPKNLQNPAVRVQIVLKRKDGTSKKVTCSKPVSDGIRNKTIELGHVLNFEILEGESGIPYISMPSGELVRFSVKSITAKEFQPKVVALEDLI